MTTLPRQITGGVDTHLDVHVAAALDERGALLGVESFDDHTSRLRQAPDLAAELRHRRAPGRRGHRLLRGRPDPAPPLRGHPSGRGRPAQPAAPSPAREVRSRRRHLGRPGRPRRDATGEAKTRDGNVEAMRVLRVARGSARKGRTQALNQMRSLISTGPDCVRAELRRLNVYRMLERASSYRPGTKRDLVSINKFTLRMLARRAIELEAEVTEIDAILKADGRRDGPRALAPSPGSAPTSPLRYSSPRATILSAFATRRRSLTSAGRAPSTPAAASRSVTGSTAAAIAKPTRRCGTS